jgi:alkylation response protein AidB-like acyl-CoA dehydrogenase
VITDDAVEIAEQVARQLLANNVERVDAQGEWPGDNIRALQQAGLAGVVLPADVGGHGLGLFAVARLCDVLGYVCPSTAISFGMHLVGSAVLAAKATPMQRERYLRAIAAGQHLTTLALSEPGTGSHFYIPETQLTPTASGFTLRGTKSFVTNGGFADSYVVSAAPARPDAAPGEFSCVVVRKGSPGLAWTGDWRGWGMRGNAARAAQLEDVAIPRDDLLGDEGDEIWFVFNVITPYFLMAMAGTYLGIARAALELVREHVGARSYTHTGSSIADNAVVQHRIGSLWASVHRTRALIWDAARMGDAGERDALLALCSAKAEVAEVAERVTADAMTLVGGRGYGEGHPLQRLYRDARAAHVMAPTTDVLRTWTGRAFLNRPILGD